MICDIIHIISVKHISNISLKINTKTVESFPIYSPSYS